MARRMKPETAIRRARAAYRLERRDSADGICWMVLDATNSGNGVYGEEADGRNHYEKTIMFRALEMLDSEYDWHDFDWHRLSGSAETRVAQMLEWRKEQEEARAAVEPYHALVRAMMRR